VHPQRTATTFRVGLTGGIGSGKSTVAAGLQACGAALIDTDVIAHALTAPGGAAMAPIAAQFGAAYVAADGALERAKMRELVFADDAARARLEAILHPLIRRRTEHEARAAATSAPYVVLAIPLLVESGNWRQRVDRVLVVDCAAATQIARVQQRSGLSSEAVAAIIARQATRAQRLDSADDIVVNEGPLDALRASCARLHALYVHLASAQRAAASAG
jgi:dephospho-CoA kinase